MGPKRKMSDREWHDHIIRTIEEHGFSTVSSWSRAFRHHYEKALICGWQNDIRKRFGWPPLRHHRVLDNWGINELVADIRCKGFQTIDDWRRGDSAIYKLAIKNQWLPRIHEILGWRRKKSIRGMTLEEVTDYLRGQQFGSFYQWKSKTPTMFDHATRSGWLENIGSQFGWAPWRSFHSMKSWTVEEFAQYVKDLGADTVDRWRELDPESLRVTKDREIFPRISRSLGWMVTRNLSNYTLEDFVWEAARTGAKSLAELEKKDGSLYRKLLQEKLTRQVADSLGWNVLNSYKDWTYNDFVKHCTQFCSIDDWCKKEPGSYKHALTRDFTRRISGELGWSEYIDAQGYAMSSYPEMVVANILIASAVQFERQMPLGPLERTHRKRCDFVVRMETGDVYVEVWAAARPQRNGKLRDYYQTRAEKEEIYLALGYTLCSIEADVCATKTIEEYIRHAVEEMRKSGIQVLPFLNAKTIASSSANFFKQMAQEDWVVYVAQNRFWSRSKWRAKNIRTFRICESQGYVAMAIQKARELFNLPPQGPLLLPTMDEVQDSRPADKVPELTVVPAQSRQWLREHEKPTVDVVGNCANCGRPWLISMSDACPSCGCNEYSDYEPVW